MSVKVLEDLLDSKDQLAYKVLMEILFPKDQLVLKVLKVLKDLLESKAQWHME